MLKPGSLLALACFLMACSSPSRPLEYTEDPPAELTPQERLQRALDSLERERCWPPECYPDPMPPGPPG
jgi:hypothetical protein